MGDMGTSSSKQTDVRIFFETMPSERTPVGIVGITLCLFNIAMENGPFIDDVPSYKPPFIGDSPWLC